MHFTTTTAAAAASFLNLASAQLDKPVIDPPFPNGGLDSLSPGLLDNLSPVQSTNDDWDEGFLPQDCKSLAVGNNFSPFDISAFNIHYDDCQDPWIFCRHKDSPLSKESMIDVWGRIPVRMRSYVRHIIALPGNPSAGSNGDNVQMNGDIGITVYVHETGHSLDSNAFDKALGQPFSSGQVWLDAYNLDSAVTDGYAQSSQQENFAQETVVALYDKNVPGGVGTIQPNFQAIQHAYTTIQQYLPELVVPGGECANRLENSPSVPKGDSAKFRVNMANKPDVSLKGNVTVIKSAGMKPSFTLTEFDKAGKPIGSRVVNLNL